MKFNIVAVVLIPKIVKVKYYFVPITEFTIIDFIDLSFSRSFKIKTFAVNVTGITLN